jgi:hypothetical protein
MGPWAFAKSYGKATIGMTVGAVVTVGGLALDGYHLLMLGLPGWGVAAIGALVFMFSVFALVYQHHQRTEVRLTALSIVRANVEATPAAVPTPAAVQLPPPPPPENRVRSGGGRRKNRIYLGNDFDLETLFSIMKNNTSLRAAALIAPYLEKSVVISAIFQDLDQYTTSESYSVFLKSSGEIENRRYFHCTFDASWKETLEILERGKIVTIDGKISRVQPDAMNLSDCEIVSR